MGIYNPLTDELRAVVCPAGEAIGAARGQRLANTPAVNCRITHDVLSMDGDTATLCRWCCHPEGGSAPPGNGYIDCPVWTFEKHRLWKNEHTLGDEDRMHEMDEQQWREDLTGSRYGDTSFMAAIEERVQANAEEVQRTGTTIARAGVNLEIEP